MSKLKNLIPKYHKRYYKRKAVILGPRNAGKTVIIKRFIFGEEFEENIKATIGIDVRESKDKEVQKNDFISIKSTDVAGQIKFRHLWEEHIKQNEIIIYVVDSADQDTFEEAVKEFNRLIRPIKDKPIMILANKQDIPGAAREEKFTKLFGDDYGIIETSAKSGEGLKEFYNQLLAFSKELATKEK